MGLFRKYVNQTRKPEGFLGEMMVNGMNGGHAKMADWGMSFIPRINPSDIVDLGCGGGRNAGALLKKYQGAVVTALDYSEVSVDKARIYNKDAVSKGKMFVVRGDVSNLKIPAEKYDLATAFETIYFWPGLEKCFSEVSKVLKPGGLFLVVNESDGTDETSLKFEKLIDGMKCHTPEAIRTAMETAGFKDIQIEHHEKKPWIAVYGIKA